MMERKMEEEEEEELDSDLLILAFLERVNLHSRLSRRGLSSLPRRKDGSEARARDDFHV